MLRRRRNNVGYVKEEEKTSRTYTKMRLRHAEGEKGEVDNL